MMRSEDERSFSSLLRALIDDVVTLVRKELELARAEMGESLDEARGGLIAMMIGLGFLLGGIAVALFAAVYGLALVMPVWAAALCVGGAACLIGAVLIFVGGRHARPSNLVPRRTIHAAEEDYAAIRERLS